jgi:hypothetical protein
MNPSGENIQLNEESDAYDWFDPYALEGLNVTKNTRLIAAKYASLGRADV